ncbi:hypothetical protein COCOR_00792 [Corallococcus coralloides DSM 2259]|uniref:Lipoprotein n=1 Tax=Corallococcus coralloides (strain ATCC 25202 / DSM 2259 / NBRC 100086 / M2) TaxID=1144275 RepID=H8MIQ7_CORCM|nr:hypothetical protein [Corallococcus coralloides]AFE03708.1 hypothetical protein COCOR_00792 [Corallococcus coralloides DSM 2259]
MRLPWLVLSLFWALVGCSGATKVVRLDTGLGSPVVHVPRAAETARPVQLDAVALKEAVARLAPGLRLSPRAQDAARRLFEVEPRSGSYLLDVQRRRITPLGPGEHLTSEQAHPDVELTRAYLRWCGRTGRTGDCLGLLKESPVITGDARFALALALAKGAVLDELWDAVKGMANPEALMQAALWTAATYALLWTVPEPATKGVAAVLTAALIGYVGIDTFWALTQGFRHLMAESDAALTFDELRGAGERFGKVMGRQAARAFVMLATAAIGSTGATLGAKLPGLPGAAQAAVRAEAEAGVVYAAVGSVESVAVAADGFTVGLAPSAVAMSSRGTPASTTTSRLKAWKSFSGFKKAMGPAGSGNQWHHIVEQTPGNVQRFGPEAIHNTENVIAIDEQIHKLVSSYYSSRQAVSGGQIVREWLRLQPYEQQRAFGLQTLKDFGAIQ